MTQAGLLWVRRRHERANPACGPERGYPAVAAELPASWARAAAECCGPARDQPGRGGHIEPDRQGCSPRPRSWPLSHRLDQGSHDAPGADHRADSTWPRARCAVSVSRRTAPRLYPRAGRSARSQHDRPAARLTYADARNAAEADTASCPCQRGAIIRSQRNNAHACRQRPLRRGS